MVSKSGQFAQNGRHQIRRHPVIGFAADVIERLAGLIAQHMDMRLGEADRRQVVIAAQRMEPAGRFAQQRKLSAAGSFPGGDQTRL